MNSEEPLSMGFDCSPGDVATEIKLSTVDDGDDEHEYWIIGLDATWRTYAQTVYHAIGITGLGWVCSVAETAPTVWKGAETPLNALDVGRHLFASDAKMFRARMGHKTWRLPKWIMHMRCKTLGSWVAYGTFFQQVQRSIALDRGDLSEPSLANHHERFDTYMNLVWSRQTLSLLGQSGFTVWTALAFPSSAALRSAVLVLQSTITTTTAETKTKKHKSH